MSPVVVILVLAVVGISTIIINSATLWIVFTSQRLRKPAYYPIVSFVITGILEGAIVVPVYCIKRLELPDSPNWVCDLFRFPYFLCGHMLTLSILLVAIERVVAIKFTFRHRSLTRQSTMFAILSCLWLVFITIDILPFVHGAKQNKSCKYVPWREWSVAVLLLTIVLPMIIIVASYAWIWRQAVKHAERIQASSAKQSCSQTKRFKYRIELRATRTTLLLVGIFFITWAPIGIYYLVENVCNDCVAKSMSPAAQENFRIWVKIISFTTCIFSPLAYCWRTREFRHELISSMHNRNMRVPALAIQFVQRLNREENAKNKVKQSMDTSL